MWPPSPSSRRPRWPSTESVAKSLAATNTSINTFISLISETGKTARQTGEENRAGKNRELAGGVAADAERIHAQPRNVPPVRLVTSATIFAATASIS